MQRFSFYTPERIVYIDAPCAIAAVYAFEAEYGYRQDPFSTQDFVG